MKKLVVLSLCFTLEIMGYAQIVVIPPEYNDLRGFSEGLAAIMKGEKWGFVDIKGNVVIPPIYKAARDFHEGKAAVKTDKGWGYINVNNELVIPDKFFDARDFSEGLASVKSTINTEDANDDGYEGEYWGHSFEMSSWQYITPDGTLAFDGHFRDVSTFHDGVACVFKETFWEFINKEGKTILKTKYDNYYPVHYASGLIPNVGGDLNDEWGYCDLTGSWIIEPQYRSVTEFCDGIAVVEDFGGKQMVIDNTGEVLHEGKSNKFLAIKGGFILDKKSMFNKNDLTNPVISLDVFDDYWLNYWLDCGIITVPSPPPGGVSAGVSPKAPLNILTVDIIRNIKAIYFKYPGDGLWATQFDNGYWGFTALDMQDYIRQYVLSQMKDWLKKGEFESSAAYQKRTNETNRQQQMAMYANDLINSWLKRGYNKWTLSNYDADHQTYALTTDIGQYVIHVEPLKAKALKENWEKIEKEVTLTYKDGLCLCGFSFNVPNADSFVCTIDPSLEYDGNDVSVDISGNSLVINIVDSKDNEENKQARKSVMPKQPSDVDIAIPTTSVNNKNTFAVIIGNEKYDHIASVPYAANDARIFAEYCKKTLGLPENNVREYEDATFGTILNAVSDVSNIAKAYNGDINVIFYYAGHGIPDEKTRDAFLLPVDANDHQTEIWYSKDRLYKELGEMGAKNVVVFLDACFSGAQRGGKDMLASGRGVSIKPKIGVPQGNTVVFSATTDDERAFPYEEKGHGLFTYFLLKKLRDTKGDCTLGELGEYIQTNVCQQSSVIIRKSQTPSIVPSGSMGDSWKNLKLR